MKTITMAISVLMVGLLLVTGCSEVKAMPKELAKSTQKIVDDVKDLDRDVFEEIQRNTEVVDRLRAEIENSDESDKQTKLNKVIKELEKITKSYEDLSDKRDDVRKDLLKKVTAIEKLQEDVQEETARLRELRSTYTTTLNTFVDSNPEVVRTRKAALTQAIKYIDMQLQLWNEFNRTEQQIKKETMIVQQRIDSFLSVIESSAVLFREGLNLLKLQRDINDALSLFTQDLPRMEQLSEDMEQSWCHLDTLVNTLTSMGINIDRN